VKKKDKQYIFFSIVISTFLFILFPTTAYILDFAGVNNRFDLGIIKDSNLALRTQKFTEMNRIKPNTLMFGGSRMHYLSTQDVKKYTQDKVYNVGLSDASLEEQYYFLKFAVDNFDIKHVIIALNLYPFSETTRTYGYKDFDKEVFKEGFTLKKQMTYYIGVPLIKRIKEYQSADYLEPLYIMGAVSNYNQERIIKSDSWEEREKRSLNQYNMIYKEYLSWGTTQLKIYKKMVRLCQDNKIDLKVFTTGVYASQFMLLQDLNKMDMYYKWKKELAKIVEYYDFMYLNSVTTDNQNYIDTSHMRQDKGHLYFAKIFNDKSVNVPKDFGVLVTKGSVDQYIKSLKTNINK